MRIAAFTLLLLTAIPSWAALIAYDYTGQIYDVEGTERTETGVTGTVVFDTSFLGIKEFTAEFDNQNPVWRSDTAFRLQLSSLGGGIEYLMTTGGSSFDEQTSGYSFWPLWEVHFSEPTSLSAVLNNFNRFWSPETSPIIGTPEYGGTLQFLSVGPAYSVPEPTTLSLLALGLAAIGIRRKLR